MSVNQIDIVCCVIICPFNEVSHDLSSFVKKIKHACPADTYHMLWDHVTVFLASLIIRTHQCEIMNTFINSITVALTPTTVLTYMLVTSIASSLSSLRFFPAFAAQIDWITWCFRIVWHVRWCETLACVPFVCDTRENSLAVCFSPVPSDFAIFEYNASSL